MCYSYLICIEENHCPAMQSSSSSGYLTNRLHRNIGSTDGMLIIVVYVMLYDDYFFDV